MILMGIIALVLVGLGWLMKLENPPSEWEDWEEEI